MNSNCLFSCMGSLRYLYLTTLLSIIMRLLSFRKDFLFEVNYLYFNYPPLPSHVVALLKIIVSRFLYRSLQVFLCSYLKKFYNWVFEKALIKQFISFKLVPEFELFIVVDSRNFNLEKKKKSYFLEDLYSQKTILTTLGNFSHPY